MTRIPPELHRQVNIAATLSGKSLNAWVGEQLQNAVQGPVNTKGNTKPAGKKPPPRNRDPENRSQSAARTKEPTGSGKAGECNFVGRSESGPKVKMRLLNSGATLI